jgi:hypothetical protein
VTSYETLVRAKIKRVFSSPNDDILEYYPVIGTERGNRLTVFHSILHLKRPALNEQGTPQPREVTALDSQEPK